MIPKLPAWIARPGIENKDILTVWLLLAPKLYQRGILEKSDLPALELYCTALALLRKCQAENQGSQAELETIRLLKSDVDMLAAEFFIGPGQYEISPDDDLIQTYYQALNDVDKIWLDKMLASQVVYLGARRLAQQGEGQQQYLTVAQEAGQCVDDLWQAIKLT